MQIARALALLLALSTHVFAQSQMDALIASDAADNAEVNALIQAERNAILYQHLELERAEAYERQRENTAERWREHNAESQRMIDASTARREESIRRVGDQLDQIEQQYRDRLNNR